MKLQQCEAVIELSFPQLLGQQICDAVIDLQSLQGMDIMESLDG